MYYSGFLVFQNILSSNLCKTIRDLITYSPFICPFESGKCGKEGEKLLTFEYLGNKKNFLDEIKAFFIVFERLSFNEKVKIVDTSFR